MAAKGSIHFEMKGLFFMLFDLKAISSPCHCFQDQKWHKNANEGAKNTAADEKSAEYMITLSNHKILTCTKRKLFFNFKRGFFRLQFYSQLRFSDAVFCVFRKVVKFSWDASSSCESLSWNAAKDIIKFLCAAPGICCSPPPLRSLRYTVKAKVKATERGRASSFSSKVCVNNSHAPVSSILLTFRSLPETFTHVLT